MNEEPEVQHEAAEPVVEEVVAEKKAPPSLREALEAAPTVWEVLGRPQAYQHWYETVRKEALDG